MKKQKETTVFKGKWLNVKELTFTNRENQKIIWESIERKNSTKIVVIVAKTISSRQYVLIKQFRPALNTSVIGFPAGIAQSDDIAGEAQKELREETGFWGTVKDISPDLAFNPALSCELVNIVTMEIDEKDPRNKNPQQHLEPSEQIDVQLVAEERVKDYLVQERKQGQQVSVALWYLFNKDF